MVVTYQVESPIAVVIRVFPATAPTMARLCAGRMIRRQGQEREGRGDDEDDGDHGTYRNEEGVEVGMSSRS